MTKAPLLDNATDLIEVHFDGRFVDTQNPSNVAEINTEWQTRIDSSSPNFELQELFISQFTADQIVSFLYNKKAPLVVGSPNLSSTIGQLMPELKLKYGFGVQISIGVELAEGGEGMNAVTFDSTKGIVLGSVDGSAIPLQLTFMCTNATVVNDVAMILDASIMVALELELKDFLLSVQVGDYDVSNGSVVEDNVGLWDRDYTKLLYDVMTTFITDFNIKRAKPMSFADNKFAALIAADFV